MADLENEKKTAISQDWQHKKPSYQSFSFGKQSEDVGIEAILSEYLDYYFLFPIYLVCRS